MEIVPSLTLEEALSMPLLTAASLARAKNRLYKKAMKRSKSASDSGGGHSGGSYSGGGIRRQRIGSMAELSQWLSRGC